jgi:hypothetical protein
LEFNIETIIEPLAPRSSLIITDDVKKYHFTDFSILATGRLNEEGKQLLVSLLDMSFSKLAPVHIRVLFDRMSLLLEVSRWLMYREYCHCLKVCDSPDKSQIVPRYWVPPKLPPEASSYERWLHRKHYSTTLWQFLTAACPIPFGTGLRSVPLTYPWKTLSSSTTEAEKIRNDEFNQLCEEHESFLSFETDFPVPCEIEIPISPGLTSDDEDEEEEEEEEEEKEEKEEKEEDEEENSRSEKGEEEKEGERERREIKQQVVEIEDEKEHEKETERSSDEDFEDEEDDSDVICDEDKEQDADKYCDFDDYFDDACDDDADEKDEMKEVEAVA